MMQESKLPRGIDIRPDGQYRARVTYRGTRVDLGRFFALGDAEAALAIARGEIASKTFTPPAEIREAQRKAAAAKKAEQAAAAYTVAELFDDWVEWQQRRGLAEGTIYTRTRHFERHMRERFGARAAASIVPAEIDEWYDRIHKENGPGAARGAYQALSSMFNYGAGTTNNLPRGYVPKIPVSPCQVPGADKHVPVKVKARGVATPEEVAALAGGMPASEQLAVLLMAWCTTRIGETLALRKSDFYTTANDDWTPGDDPELSEDWWMRVERLMDSRGSGLQERGRTKSVAGLRVEPVPRALVPVLKAHFIEHCGLAPDALLFPRTPRGGRALHPNTLRSHFEKSLDAFNAERQSEHRPTLYGFTPHDLRHTALTRYGQAGATTAELMRLGGHADGKMVQRYQHAELSRLAMLAAALNEDVQVPGELAPVTSLAERRARGA